jgi:hypothetical protein
MDMDPMAAELLGGGDGTWLFAILANPFASAAAWVLPVALEIGLVWWGVRVWRRHRARAEARAWAEPADGFPPRG